MVMPKNYFLLRLHSSPKKHHPFESFFQKSYKFAATKSTNIMSIILTIQTPLESIFEDGQVETIVMI